MIVYHGSNHNFKQLKISPSLCERRSTPTNEGYGIYFTTDKETAREYGQHIYTIEINDNALTNLWTKEGCKAYLQDIIDYVKAGSGVDITPYLYDTLATNMYCGGICIFKLSEELALELESREKFYMDCPEKTQNKVYALLKKWDKDYLPKAYTFNNSIKNIGVIKNVSPDVCNIISKEPSYGPGSDYVEPDKEEDYER